LAVQFAAHALSLVPDVYLLLRLAFLGNVDHAGLRRVLVFRRQLPRMPMAFSWICWRRNYATMPDRPPWDLSRTSVRRLSQYACCSNSSSLKNSGSGGRIAIAHPVAQLASGAAGLAPALDEAGRGHAIPTRLRAPSRSSRRP
jgi:hypothetical protein